MAINTIQYASVFQQELDKQMVSAASSGWMEENAGQVIYSGGSTVKIPKITMDGMGNYDRDDGFTGGSVTLAYETHALSQDRGRSFQLDAMDVDETNFAMSAGSVMGEFQAVKVAPEIDAYRYSRLFALASAANRTATYSPSPATILSTLKDEIAQIQDTIGSQEELVITMNTLCAAVLDKAEDMTHVLRSDDFLCGGITTRVTSLDGMPIIKAPSGLMKTAYSFLDGVSAGQTAGGFAAAAGAQQINWIICARKAPIGVSKTDTVRIFDPLHNQKANAWKLDYRKYHDLWVPDNKMDGLWVNVQPEG